MITMFEHKGCGGHAKQTIRGNALCNKCKKIVQVSEMPDNAVWVLGVDSEFDPEAS